MPVLTPLPPSLATTVSPPGEANKATDTTSAQAAGGESREGNPTNAKQKTWTRLFQSLLEDNLPQGDSGKAAGPARNKGRDSRAVQPSSNTAASAAQTPVIALPIAPAPPAPIEISPTTAGSGAAGGGSQPSLPANAAWAGRDEAAGLSILTPAQAAETGETTSIAPAQNAPGFDSQAQALLDPPANSATAVEMTASYAAEALAAASAVKEAAPVASQTTEPLSPIAQDDRTPGSATTAAQATSQGGRPLGGAGNTPDTHTATDIQDRVADAFGRSGVPSDKSKTAASTDSAANGATTGDSMSTAAGESGSSQPTASGIAGNVAGGPPVQASSQAERIDVIRQIASQASSLNPADGSQNTITMQIHPAHWGQVTVSVSLLPAETAANGEGNSAVAATLITADPAVRDALQGHVEDLSRALTSAGFQVGKVEVVVQSATATTAGQSGSAFHQGQNGNGGNGFTPNPGGLSAQTSGGGGHQGAPFGASHGQNQGDGRGQGLYQTSNPSGAAEAESGPATPATVPVAKGRIDYRI